VNVSTTVLTDLVRQSKVDNVAKLGALFAEHAADPAAFFAHDPRGKKIPGFVQALAQHLGQEQRIVMAELESLRKSVEHIKEIVAMQQSYAKVSGVSEMVPVVDLIEDALRMNAGAFVRHDVGLVRDFRANPAVSVEKHKVLQILVNLLRNAKYACDDTGRSDKQIIVRSSVEGGVARVEVIDNGVGIPPENLTRIFSHGFTTRKQGHGFGLHSGALAAKELGGRLLARSEGPGKGATFLLEMPLTVEAKAA
jgi:signal transduction histidine kinase